MGQCTHTGLSTVTVGSTMAEAQGSGTAMMTDGKNGVKLTEIYSGNPIINMVVMDTVATKRQAEVESTVPRLRGRTVETH